MIKTLLKELWKDKELTFDDKVTGVVLLLGIGAFIFYTKHYDQ